MIDLHFHCLPGIDDGPLAWESSVELCRLAASEGTTRIVATPHVHRHPWVNEERAERAALLARLNENLDGEVEVLPGCEAYYSDDLVELCELGEASPLVRLNDSRYLLVEFPATQVPRNAEHVLYELKFVGVVPLIAHPERNLVFQREPERLERMVANGAITQLTAASLLDEFGPAASAATSELLRRNLIHLVASDAHNSDRRPPRMKAAYERAAALLGNEIAERLFVTNPRAVVEDAEVV
jgi:protein-tyrosine phosphatase